MMADDLTGSWDSSPQGRGAGLTEQIGECGKVLRRFAGSSCPNGLTGGKRRRDPSAASSPLVNSNGSAPDHAFHRHFGQRDAC